MVSKEYFEQTRPDLKSVLLSFRFGERGDELDELLNEARAVAGRAFIPRDIVGEAFTPEEEELSGNDGAGHQHPERASSAKS